MLLWNCNYYLFIYLFIVSFCIFVDTSLLPSSESDLYNETFISITELKKVMDWLTVTSNKLLLNYSKSQYIFFGPLYQTKYEKVFILNDL